MKVVIGIPTPEQVSANFSLHNLPSIISYSKENIKDLELYVIYKTGVMTSSNRNYIVTQALENDVDYILWLDSDMIYPVEILKVLIDSKKDIIGSIYFKRSPPYDPVVYIKGDNPNKPYKIINPYLLKDVTEVDGLGFGGLLVHIKVYKDMASRGIWHRYGTKFGYPQEQKDQESHDLIFCKEAQKLDYKIFVHHKVRCGHITEKVVTGDDWVPKGYAFTETPSVSVLMPSIDIEKAEKTLKQLQLRASFPASYYILEDIKRQGFIKTINEAVSHIKADYYVYVAEDAFAGLNWLYNGMNEISKKDAGLLAFNDGKNNGKLATFGLIRYSWVKQFYNGQLFYEKYHSHYADTELSMLATKYNKIAYNPHATLIEVDYEKETKSVNIEDKTLYSERVKKLQLPTFFS
jgi:hypothetical protein